MTTKYQINVEWLRAGWCRSDRALRRVYNDLGPKVTGKGKFRVFPSKDFAKMTKKQVDAKWDFPGRHLMHQVAKALEHD